MKPLDTLEQFYENISYAGNGKTNSAPGFVQTKCFPVSDPGISLHGSAPITYWTKFMEWNMYVLILSLQ